MPEIFWHDRLAILSIDISKKLVNCVGSLDKQTYKIATASIQKEIRLWDFHFDKVESEMQEANCEPKNCDSKFSLSVDFVANLVGHDCTTNVVRFSPDGNFLASGDVDGRLVVWQFEPVQIIDIEIEILEINEEKENQSQPRHNNANKDLIIDEFPPNKENWVRACVIRHFADVTSLAFSPDSSLIASVSADDSIAVHIAETGKKVWRIEHFRHFANGIAWDPCGKFIVTLSTDRRMDILDSQKGHILKSCHTIELPDTDFSHEIRLAQKKYRVFHDDQLSSFTRGIDFSPCGELIFAPSAHLEVESNNLYGIFVFRRNEFRPFAMFPSVKPSSMVKCSPMSYDLSADHENFLQLPYRLIFAVMLKDSILVYNSQQQCPFTYIDNLQLDTLSCISWTPDGKILVVSSHEGYNTFIVVDENKFGHPCNPQPLPRTIEPISILASNKSPKIRKKLKNKASDRSPTTASEITPSKIVHRSTVM